MTTPVLHSPRQSLAFDPLLGGRVTSWVIDGTEVLTGAGPNPVEHGIYPMAPWAGRLRDNRITAGQRERWGIAGAGDYTPEITFAGWAIHGTCLDAPVDTWELEPDRITLRQRIPGWPATLVTAWTIADLTTTSRLTVEAEKPTPALLGWHPWFPTRIDGASAKWSLDGELAVREGAFPSGEWRTWTEGSTRVDDAFHVPDGTVEITWGTLSLSIRNSDPWFVIFDERDGEICVEPQNGPPNAFDVPLRGDPPVARPGDPVTMTTTWEWRSR